MKRALWLGLAAIVVAAAAPEPLQEVQEVIRKLGESGYAWSSIRTGEGAAAASSGTVEGAITREGLSRVTLKMGEGTYEGALKGEKTALNLEGVWKAADEIGGGGGSPRDNPVAFIARHLGTIGRAPASHAAALLKRTQGLKIEAAGVYSAALTEEGVKENLPQFGVTIAEPSGSVTFWIKDGMLAKYEMKVKAKITFGAQGQPTDFIRSSVVEIKEAGTAKVDLPAKALKKLE